MLFSSINSYFSLAHTLGRFLGRCDGEYEVTQSKQSLSTRKSSPTEVTGLEITLVREHGQ